MRTIDMHCDTLMDAYFKKGTSADLYDHLGTMVDLQYMKEGQALAQFFAIFVLPQSGYQDWFHVEPVSDETYINSCIEIFHNSIAKHSDIIAEALSADDIRKNDAAGKMSAILTMEDGAVVNGKLDSIKYYYELGVRALSLTWNYENCFGAPNSKNPEIMKKGLTAFGKEAVDYMQQLGMLVDISHLSDGGFYDVASICKKPFVATHSNCRALSPHQRNLTDDMLRILGEKGGVAGINFGPEFLNADIADRRSTIERIVAMAAHMKNVGGIDVVAIGTDFDGIGGKLEIDNCSKMGLLSNGLEHAGFTESEIEKVMNENVMRVLGSL